MPPTSCDRDDAVTAAAGHTPTPSARVPGVEVMAVPENIRADEPTRIPGSAVPTLPAALWRERAAEHRRRIDELLDTHPPRLPDGSPHPVWSFLFTYYSFRRAALRTWHPGFGVVLCDAADYVSRRGYRRVAGTTDEIAVTVDVSMLRRHRDLLAYVHRLLSATAARPARLHCFGLHEWAMVYRTSEVRHDSVPLRLGSAGTDEVVESLPLRCTHFDAFRFFTDEAAPRNELPLEREGQIASEQPGCVHAGMDLYKWATKLSPLLPAELVADAFALALDLRELDMKASPYDLRDHGLEPIAIETTAGRAAYAREQERLAGRAAELRDRLLTACDALTAAE